MLTMKKFIISHFTTVIILFTHPYYTHAQDYLVTLQGDTVAGELRPYTLGPSKKVSVTSSDGTKTSYPILKLRSYHFEGETYEPVRSERGYEFMKVIKPGYLTLYGFQLENQSRFDGLFLRKKDGTYQEVPNLSFKKIMKKFLEDCPEVSAKIETGEFEKRELHQLVDAYNACIINRTQQGEKELALQKKTFSATLSWDSLEQKIKDHPGFTRKTDALEMIADIKGRVGRSEKIPNFVLEGLKEALAETDLSKDLDEVLKETQK